MVHKLNKKEHKIDTFEQKIYSNILCIYFFQFIIKPTY